MPAIAKVVVEIALDREFDYLIPNSLIGQIRLGSRVRVPFGRRETSGYVVGLAERSERPDLKAITAPIGAKPILSESVLELARWISRYYAATIEQAIRTVLPCAVRRPGARFKERRMVKPADPGSVVAAARLTTLQRRVLDEVAARGPIPLEELAEICGCTAGVVQRLGSRGLLAIESERSHRDPFANREFLRTEPLSLSEEQSAALALALRAIDTLEPPVVLLHGVTGSGKTEVYLQAIQHALDKGRGAIVLVPEISLTPQTVERFRGRFGDTVALLHSHLSDGERHDEWHRVFEGAARIVIGARSALFAPVSNLGLIVVDEEHEPSYKQAEVPRYNARDVAVMRGRIEKCAVLLGSATPALESYNNARAGKYALAVLPRRVDQRKMPALRVVDMRVEARKTGKPGVFSAELVEAVRRRIENGEQTILFLNRRGYASALLCPLCGYVASCTQCSVGMTYHRQGEQLRCHLCGRTEAVPVSCPGCGSQAFKYAGIGTQRIESVVKTLFPHARVLRMDLDTTRGKNAYDEMLGAFKGRKVDILIGTQMIAKGLHFPGVTLVGVIYADLSLHIPDFRAGERTLQLLLQVAGRAGRGETPGEVIVQTFTPHHPAIQAARRLDFEGFYDQEIEARRDLLLPPFSHMVCVTLDGKDETTVECAARAFVAQLRPRMADGVTLTGPGPAPLARVKGRHRRQILIKSASPSSITGPLKTVLARWRAPRGVSMAVDVDAINLM